MIFTTNYANGQKQTIEFETDAFVFSDWVGIYSFDTKPYSIQSVRTNFDGNIYNENNQAISIHPMVRDRIKTYLLSLKDNNYIDMSDTLLTEMNSIIDSMPLYLTGSFGGGLQSAPWTTTPTTIEVNNAWQCASPYGCPYGIAMKDIWNNNPLAENRHYVYGTMDFNERANFEMPLFFNLLSRGIEEKLIKPSEDLKKFVEDNIYVLPTAMSCNWDYYFNYHRNFSINRIDSVIVRWSCPAVNQGTEEFLEKQPNYIYRADLTKIVLEVANMGELNKNWKTIYSDWYGVRETELPFNMLQDNTSLTQSSIMIGKVFPFLSTGDVYLRAHLEFANGQNSSYVIGQCPSTSHTDDVSKLSVLLVNPKDGSTLTLHYGAPTEGISPEVVGWTDDGLKRSDEFEDNDSSVDFDMDVGTNSNIGLLTKTYAITENQLKQIGNKIWSGYFTELIDALNSSPIENIISVKSFPFPIEGGTSTEIMLGNVQMGVNGNELPSTFIPIKTIKTDFQITPRFSGLLKWLNYSPFTNIQMFLPYVGLVNIEPQLVMGKKCTLKYIYDVILGNCQACLYVKDNTNKTVEIGKWSGDLAIDIPITASNAVRVGVGHLNGTLSAISDLFRGNLLGTVSDLVGVATTPFHSMTKGSPSSACDSFDMQNAYLIINSPIYKYPTNFGHVYGYPCELWLNLNNLHGFVQCGNVHIDGIPCMEEERNELVAILEEGIYL